MLVLCAPPSSRERRVRKGVVALKYARNGITAVDLIIVVVVIVVLAFALFSVVFQESIPSRKSSCQNNMKHCALALVRYMSDYDGCFPSSACVSGSEKWNKEDFLVFATKSGELPVPSGTHPKTWPQVLYSRMNNKDIIVCPSDPADSQWADADVSYWWKLAIDKAWYGEDCSKEYRNESDYPRPQDCIILYEHMGFHSGSKKGLVNGVRINCAFLDSHVRSYTIQNATSGDPIDCAANADGEPMYFNLDNSKEPGPDNPPEEGIPATYVDPGRYSDRLP